jgi:8-oxo-dGTP pyrophosphatase MutT (NUDIX family)
MHITRHIIQELAMELGQPVIEYWSFKMGEEEFSRLKAHIDRGRVHDATTLVLRGDELVVVRKPGYPPNAYRAPSGGIHPEESFLDGTAREAWEETGLKVQVDGYLLRVHATFSHGEDSAKWTTHVMLAKPLTDELGPIDKTEIESARWISWDELLSTVNPVLEKSGLGGLAYRAQLHRRSRELLLASKDQSQG